MAEFNLAGKLKQARIIKGLTQKQVYQQLGVVQSTFSSWETGKAEPDAETLIKLCQIYGITSLDYFISNDSEKEKLYLNNLSLIEKEIIDAYRASPDMQKAVNRLLGISPGGFERNGGRSYRVGKAIAFGGASSKTMLESNDEEIAGLLNKLEDD